jgi:hypothetical protein
VLIDAGAYTAHAELNMQDDALDRDRQQRFKSVRHFNRDPPRSR